MFRNQYDNDVTVWSPQGRIHQIEYAMEAVKQGSATVGVKSDTHAILLALKRASSELSAHQKKIIAIDKHVGISIAGLTADARILSKFLRTECLYHRYSHNEPLPVSRLVTLYGNKAQINTQRYGRRPFGVGLLVAAYDENGSHIYQTCPSANFYDCKAMAIGARSQSARTYLERRLDEIKDANLDDLIKHGMRALRDTLPNEVELSRTNCSLAIVGKDTDFTVYEDDDKIEQMLKIIEGEPKSAPVADKEEESKKDDGDDDGDDKPPEPRPAGPETVPPEQPMDQ